MVPFQSLRGGGNGYVPHKTEPLAVPPSGAVYVTRRYQFQIAAGLFQQPKLIPLKYMASQFAIEFTLSNFVPLLLAVPSTTADTNQSA